MGAQSMPFISHRSPNLHGCCRPSSSGPYSLVKFTLDAVENPRLQRMKGRTSHFNFEAVWKKGKEHATPDALSRACSIPTPGDIADDLCTHHHVQTIIRICATDLNGDVLAKPTATPVSVLEKLRRVASLDADYLRLLSLINEGFPTNSRSLDPFIHQFWKIRDNLVVDDGLILFGHPLVIPMAARTDVRQKLHAAQQGINSTKRRACQTVYWPGINNHIQSDCESSVPASGGQSTAGTYEIRSTSIPHFRDGGATAIISWRTPTVSRGGPR